MCSLVLRAGWVDGLEMQTEMGCKAIDGSGCPPRGFALPNSPEEAAPPPEEGMPAGTHLHRWARQHR